MFFSSIGQGICDIFQMNRGNTVFFLTADGVSFHIMQKKLKNLIKKVIEDICAAVANGQEIFISL